ncbi:SusD/RagB family nutrient-binding outer membrane lipoprotein [Chitinophaga nivalis]|uniref:SusD/RagB family nutrient-binding outer membrane lipoprotein n=1 Tax=Chitinophaga nivalis TaxID=2991709 RepID=A0ABT3II12_9BACT|nr:SusD/RagB family nutrient-binding outer membrane lipoprotein [Chitinophaga nivalis]MCW3466708.1 SusD/RagB family nutrient-binding outer membrane lipoprotein [Chitinophaga nivalis]MCW3483601.1 SusD/RagB family nutrient-binding outer membrane lipoprotein [Chitinophaga nivalis]
MKKRSLAILYCSLLITLGACKKFEYFQTDPNKPTESTPDLLLTSIEAKTFSEVSTSCPLAARQLVNTDGVSANQYYGWQRAGFGDFDQLRQVVKMEQAATRLNKPVYLALAKFFRAYLFMRLSLVYGDIPYSEALQGESKSFTPAYDRQETIFLHILDELKIANNLLTADAGEIRGDIVYSGKIQQWKQLINTFSLRILMSLSLKENNAKLGIQQRFREIVNNPGQYPLMTGNQDNGQLVYVDLKDNRYPFYNSNDLQTAYYLEETFVNLLKGTRDPRLFRFAQKAPQSAALPDNDFNAYGGAKGSATIDENTSRVTAGQVSKIAKRYYNDPVNEPGIAIGYAELQFILAEGVVRKWIGGNAEEYYKKGIQASMEHYKVPAADITAYKAQPAVQLLPGKEMEAIFNQKYISFFMNSGWQLFYEQRRTGLPVFDVSGNGVLNNKRIPKRWMYPEDELNLNRDNVTAAIARQFPQGDDINAVMWLLIKD